MTVFTIRRRPTEFSRLTSSISSHFTLYVPSHSLYMLRTFTLSVHVTYLHTLCTCYVPSHSLYMLRTFTLSVHVTYLHTLCTCYVPSHSLYMLRTFTLSAHSLYMLRTFTLSVHVTYLHTIVLLIACTEHETVATLCHSQLIFPISQDTGITADSAHFLEEHNGGPVAMPTRNLIFHNGTLETLSG